MLNFLTVYLNSVLCHSCVSREIFDVLLVPIVKDVMNNPSDSSNYRPIAIATASSKILEKVILSRVVSGIFAEVNFADGIFADGIFAEGIFAERNFRRTEILPNRIFAARILAERNFRQKPR